MKKLLLAFSMIVLIASLAYSQLELTKTYKGELIATTVQDAGHLTVDDTTDYVYINYGVQKLVAYVVVDTVSSGDVVDITLEGSPDGISWATNTTFTQITAAGVSRKEIAYPDPYLRFIENVTGSDVSLYRSIIIAPR